MFWRKKKYLVVIEPKKKEKKQTRGRFVRIRNVILIVVGLFIIISSVEYEKNKLKRRQAAVDILQLRDLADEYIWEHGKCPDSIEMLVVPKNPKKRTWVYDIIDPWGKKYEFICPGKKNQLSADILSAGPDRDYYTIDDVKIN